MTRPNFDRRGVISLLSDCLKEQPLDRELTGLAWEEAIEVAREHGVDGLLSTSLRRSGSWEALPDRAKASLDARARLLAVLEAARRMELRLVLGELSEAGVAPLIVKCAALAYTHYPKPYLRPCADVDMLVRRDVVLKMTTRLEAMGYTRVTSVAHELVHTQTSLHRPAGAFVHAIDLHWAVSDRPLLAPMLPVDELVENANPVAALDPRALTISPLHAMILACLHRIAHHNASERLIWLYDIRLLAERFSADDWDRFVDLASRKKLIAVCSDGLSAAADLVGGPDEGPRRFRPLEPRARRREPSAAYVGGVERRWRALMLDSRDSPGTKGQLEFVAGNLFPDRAHMREAFGASGSVGLAQAYARRAVSGAWRAVTVGRRPS